MNGTDVCNCFRLAREASNLVNICNFLMQTVYENSNAFQSDAQTKNLV